MTKALQTDLPLAVGSNDGLGVRAVALVGFEYPNGMTVAELKAMIRDWPETDEYGEPCEVWICNGSGLSKHARRATPLNLRGSEDGKKVWADFMLGHDA